MTTFLGCIADDFTGATDLASLLARSGANVSLRIGVPDETPSDTATAEFEIIALKIRTIPAAEAVAEGRQALEWLRKAGANRFFWKYCSTFDSTAQGNIGAVAEALMADLDTKQTIYCPAFPENGRAIFMGNLFVGEQPLAESPMKDHPLTPMRDSNLMRLLGPQVKAPVGLANRLIVANGPEALRERLVALAKEGIAHVVVDAVANEDLFVIARACRDMALITGGSAVAMPLPELYKRDGLLAGELKAPEPPELAPGSIILAGSSSAMTRRQVTAFTAKVPSFRIDPLKLAENGAQEACDWLAAQPVDTPKMLYATAEPDEVKAVQDKLGVEAAGTMVEQVLARLAVDARNMGMRRFVIAGGETSGAVTKALGVRQLTIGPEIAPGVPWTFCKSGGHTIALTLKSGDFGAETFFSDALARLEAA